MTNLEIEILKNCTIKATEYLDLNPWNSRHKSVTGDLVYNEILYPTKRILWAIGNQIENENLEVTLPKMSMGEELFRFFEELGFEIIRKKANNYDKMDKDIPSAYYCVGFHFYDENPTTQLPRFIKDKIWENGYDDKFINIVNDVPIGALLAAKTSYTMNEDDKTISVLEVHCIGKVISNSKNGKKLEVKWEKNFEPFSLKRKGAYRSTISKVHNQDNINAIFYNQSKAEIIKALNKFDFNNLLAYYTFLDKIIEKFELIENDKRLVFNINDKELIFTIGQRYVWNVRNLNYNNFNYRAISSTLFSSNYENFEVPNTAFLNNEKDFNLIASNQDFIFEAIEKELFRTKVSGYLKSNDILIEKLAFNKDFRERIFSQLDKNISKDVFQELKNFEMINFPLNQILYGAPGTGKTYTTKKLAIEIIDGREYVDFSQGDRDTILARYNELAGANQIHFSTFHQSMSYEDFIEGIKPETSNNNVVYEVKDGIFKKIASAASNNIDSQKISDFNFEVSFNRLIEEWEERENGEIEIKMKASSFFITKIKERNIEFRKASGGSGHELVIKTLKELAYNNRTMDSGLAVYYYPLITKLKAYNSDKKNVKLQKYVLIIDEINRGNISAIFGELITLLEEDKRKGNKEEIEVVLPYSQDKFSIPNNLYIIGTMNTADRSVESLDTALRRRFSFVEMPSKPEKLTEIYIQNADIDLVKLLDKINQRIELLIDKDHQIGHSFFINLHDLNGLKTTFKNKIIPLLEEYFFGDFGKIGLVLGENFISVKNENNNNGILAKFSAYDEVDFITEKKVYKIKNCDELQAQDFISIYE